MDHPCLSPWKGALIGGLVVFAWSSVSWMALPFHNKSLKHLDPAGPLLAAVQAAAPDSGIYLLGNDPAGKTAPSKPFVFLAVHADGWGGMGKSMGLGFLLGCVGGFFWTWILGKIPGLTAKDAALYGAFFGLAMGALCHLPNSAWWKFPWAHTAMYAVDAVVSWAVASPLIARFGRARACAV